MLVVETLVTLVERSLLCEPSPVPAFQLVLNAVGAGPGTSRSEVADVLSESAAASIVRHIPCVPLNVHPEPIIEELFAWASLGADTGGSAETCDPQLAAGGVNHSWTGFGLSRVVPLDPLVAFVAVAGSGSLEERALAAFWTLDRDGAGYLTLDQLMRLSGLLVAVAGAGCVVLNQPPLPRGVASEPPFGTRNSAPPGPSPSSTIPGHMLRPQAQPASLAPATLQDPWGQLPGLEGGMVGTGTAAVGVAAAGQSPSSGSPATAPSATTGPNGGVMCVDESRSLLDSALMDAFHEHCLPEEGPGGLPARLTADSVALVVQSVAKYITMAVVHRATSAHVLSGDGVCAHMSPDAHSHHHHHHQHQHVSSRRIFGANGGVTAGGHARAGSALPGRSSVHIQHSPHSYHHQRQHSSHNISLNGGPAPPSLPSRSQRSSATASAGVAVTESGGAGGISGGDSGGGGYRPTTSQQQLGAAQNQMIQQACDEGCVEGRSSARQLPRMSAGGALMYGENTNPISSPVFALEESSSAAVECLTPFAHTAAGGDLLSPNSSVLRQRLSSVTVTSSLSVMTIGHKSSTTAREPRAAAAISSWIRGWTWGPAARAVTSPTAAVNTTSTAGSGIAGGDGTPRQSGIWLLSGVWAATSYLSSAMWAFGCRPLAAVPTAKTGATKISVTAVGGWEGESPVQGVDPGVGPPITEAVGTKEPNIGRSGVVGLPTAAGELPPAGQPHALLTRGSSSAAATTAVASSFIPIPVPARGTPLGRVSEHPDVADVFLQRGNVQHGSRPVPAAVIAASRRAGGSPLTGAPGLPFDSRISNGDGNAGPDGSRAALATSAAVDISSLLGTDAEPAVLAALSESTKTTPGVSAGGGGVESVPATTAGAGSGGGSAGGGGGGSHPSRSVSGLLNKWRRASKSLAVTGEATGSSGHVTSSGTPAGQSTGGAAAGGGGASAMDQVPPRDGALLDDGSVPAATNGLNGGGRRRTPLLQGFAAGSAAVAGDGSVHGGGNGITAPPHGLVGNAAAGLDIHVMLGSLGHAPHSIEEAASRAELAAKAEAAAAATRGSAAAATAGATGGVAGGRETTAAPAGNAGGTASGGGTVLPPLQRAIRSSVKQAGVKLFLHCGVCLLAIIALLLLDAALIAWIYLDRKQRLSRSLVIVAATNTGLVLLVLIISIARSFMADRAAALEAEVARQAARGSAATGGGAGGAGGVLGFLLSNFVTPTLQTMGIIRGPEDAVAGRAAESGAHVGNHGGGAHEGSGWGARLRVLWTTIGRVAGFDSADDHGSGGSATADRRSVPRDHVGMPHTSSLIGPDYNYAASHAGFDLEARGLASSPNRMSMAGNGGGVPGVTIGLATLGVGGVGGNGQLGSSPYAQDGRSSGMNVAGSPFTSRGLTAPEPAALVGSETVGMALGTSSSSVAVASGRGAVGSVSGAMFSGDPRVGSAGGSGGYAATGGTAARERTRGSAMYYSSVPTMQRVEAAYPPL